MPYSRATSLLGLHQGYTKQENEASGKNKKTSVQLQNENHT